MEKVGEERYVFEVEWHDQQAALIRKYLFTYYPKDGSMDMVSNTTPYNVSTISKIDACSLNDVKPKE
jgi:hypothetical protein